jgi:hypothetical protein
MEYLVHFEIFSINKSGLGKHKQKLSTLLPGATLFGLQVSKNVGFLSNTS